MRKNATAASSIARGGLNHEAGGFEGAATCGPEHVPQDRRAPAHPELVGPQQALRRLRVRARQPLVEVADAVAWVRAVLEVPRAHRARA
eukprot:11775784-Alexandrium_andersonii.AAC.1